MLQKPILTLGTVGLLLFRAVSATQAAEFGTREEANAMLDKAIAAVKEDKERALAMFNNGESGFAVCKCFRRHYHGLTYEQRQKPQGFWTRPGRFGRGAMKFNTSFECGSIHWGWMTLLMMQSGLTGSLSLTGYHAISHSSRR